MSIVQPFYLRASEAPKLPKGWIYLQTEDASVQLKPGKLFDKKTAAESGIVPILSQGLSDYIGFHDETPGVSATIAEPVVTFANHTCAMRLMTNPFSCIQNIFPKVGKPGVTDTRYFYYASQGRVNLTDYKGHHPLFRQALIPIPPLETQRRIAGILGAYDDLIEVNRRRVAVLEEMARGLFEEWFVRFRFPGHEQVPLLVTPNGPMPQGWRWGQFSDLADEVRETLDPKSVPSDTPYVGLEHIPRRSTTLNDHGVAGEVESLKSRFQRGDILFGKIRPYFHKVAWAPCDGVASTDAIIWRPKPAHSAHALAVASSDAFVAHSVQTSNGTKMPRANSKVLAAYLCAIPGQPTGKQFEEVCMPMVLQSATLQASNERLAASRDLLLPRLISGQLSLGDAERELENAA